MAQRHPAPARSRPGFTVAQHAVVELYPRAAILTAWYNAVATGAAGGLQDCPAAQPDDPFHGSEAGVSAWSAARMPLGTALASLVAATPDDPRRPAHCVLPVPGDPGGLPAGATRAAATGQAMVIPTADASLVITPTAVAGERTVWYASRAPLLPPPAADLRSERLVVMESLSEAVRLASEATLPTADSSAVERRVARLRHVPMPPGSAGAAVELARSSATLLAMVEAAIAVLPDHGAQARRIADALRQLGVAGRRALAAAFSHAGGGPVARSRPGAR